MEAFHGWRETQVSAEIGASCTCLIWKPPARRRFGWGIQTVHSISLSGETRMAREKVDEDR